MKSLIAGFGIVVALTLVAGTAPAGTVFTASLDGTQQTPPNVSPATGMAVVELNSAMDSVSVTLDWQGLLAGATSASIHEGAPGAAGPTVFSLALGDGAGTTTGSIDPSPQTFSITPTEVMELQAGHLYVEVSSSLFPAGEIRGQLTAVPEPAGLTLAFTAIAVGLAGYGWRRRSRRRTVDRPVDACVAATIERPSFPSGISWG
jgi:hypothetical protein